jgi:LPS-assembly protein
MLDRTLPDAGIDLSTRFYRIYELPSGGDMLKHSINPQILFYYVPETNQEDLPDFDALDRIDAENLMVFRVTQFFRLKSFSPTPGSETLQATHRRLARLMFEQPYDIRMKRNPDLLDDYGSNEPLLPFRGEIELSPFAGLLLAADAEWSHDRHEIIANNASVALNDSRGDILFVEHRRMQAVGESIRTAVVLPIYGGLSAISNVEHDLYNHENIRFQAGFLYRRQCWELEAGYSDDLDDRKIAFMINLTGLGDVGTGYRMD